MGKKLLNVAPVVAAIFMSLYPSAAAAFPLDGSAHALSGSYSGVLKNLTGGDDYLFDSTVTGTVQYRRGSAQTAVGADLSAVYDSLYIAVEFAGQVTNLNNEIVGTVAGRFSENYDRIRTADLPDSAGVKQTYLYSYSEAPFAGGYMDFLFSIPAANLHYSAGGFPGYQASSIALSDTVCSGREPLCSHLLLNGHRFADFAGSLASAAGVSGIEFELWNYSAGGDLPKDYHIRDGHLEASAMETPEPASFMLFSAGLLPFARARYRRRRCGGRSLNA